MSEDIFSKKENAFDALLEEFGVTEGVQAPPTTNDVGDLFSTEPPKTTEPKTEPPKTEPPKTPNFDDLLADIPTKDAPANTPTKQAPSFDDLLADVPTTKTENTPTTQEKSPSLFDDLLVDAKPAKKDKKEPEHIPDKSEDYRVPNDVLHLDKVPKPDNSWEAEAADIVVPEVKPKGATPGANPTKGTTPGTNPTKGAIPNANPTKGANPFGAPGANPSKGASPFDGTPAKSANPSKGANPFGNTPAKPSPAKGPNPFGNTPAKSTNPAPDNFNPFNKKEPTKETLWTSPNDLDYDQLAEKIAEKLIQKIAQKLK